jgi:two-component system, sensor histidine kinase
VSICQAASPGPASAGAAVPAVPRAGPEFPQTAAQLGKVLPWAALAVLLVVTLAAFHLVKSESENNAREKFEAREAAIVDAIDERMAAYIQALRGGLGLFRSSNGVGRQEWRTYVETLNLNQIYPGIQGLGYTEWVAASERADYEARVRSQGFEDFTIRPEGQREVYSSIIYLEPFDDRNRQAFGYDMYSQETRRRGMNLARDSGRVAISGKVILVQEISEDVQAGFLMYLPYYGRGPAPTTLAGRRTASVGFVYSAFRMRNLMEGILGPGLPDVRLEIYDGADIGKDNLMYNSEATAGAGDAAFARTRQITIAQRAWTLRIASLPEFEKQLDPQKSYIVLVAGIFTSLLVFGIIWSFSRTRERAQALAEEMTLVLNQHSEELARSNEDLEQFAYVASHDLKAPLRGIDNLASWIEEDLGDKLEGESRENMQLLRGRVRRLENLLTDLLNYSRARRAECSVETVDLPKFIMGTWKLLNSEKRMQLELDTRLDSPTAQTCVTALEQVLTNLFSNAIKHHDKQNGTVFVTVTERPGWYDFAVGDDGPGIPTDQRERAFQMFQTLQPRDVVEGSGMGLAIIRKLIERLGSSIEARDRSGGRGVEFAFSWPKGTVGSEL